MTELTGTVHGTEQTVVQTPAHYLMSALDDFLIAEYPDTVLGATIRLSIGVETFLKSKLDAINPCFINHKINKNKWDEILSTLDALEPEDCQEKLLQHFLSVAQNENGNTINFAKTIEIFHLIKPIPDEIRNDLKSLRDCRNGLFHWKMDNTRTFDLSKLCLRIFLWLYTLIQDEHGGHYLSGEIIVFDPMYKKHQQLERLQKLADSNNEIGFNLERRINKHSELYSIHYRTEARLKGYIVRSDALPAEITCPACGYSEMQLSETGLIRDGVRENRDVLANCKRCDFSAFGKEHDAIKSEGHPSFTEIYDQLKMGSQNLTE